MKIGIIDMGSNTFRLVIFEIVNGQYKDIDGLRYYSGIINYVQDGCLSLQGMDTIVSVLEEMKKKLNEHRCDFYYCFATASLRSLKNIQSVLLEIQRRTGFCIEYLTGQREAYYDFVGLTYTRNLEKGIGCDIGGGSGQIFTFKDEVLKDAVSLPIGSLAMYKQFIHGMLPTEKERAQIVKFVTEQLQAYPFIKTCGFTRLYIMGGSARALGKLHRGMLSRKERLEGYSIEVKDILTMCETLMDLKMEGIRFMNQFVPARAHTIIPGMLVMDTIARFAGVKEVVVIKSGVREGYLIRILENQGLLNK